MKNHAANLNLTYRILVISVTNIVCERFSSKISLVSRYSRPFTYMNFLHIYMMYVYIPRSRIKKRGRSKSADSRILSYSILIRGNDRRKTNQRGIIPRNFFSLLPSGRSFLLHPPESGDEKRKTSENQAGNRIQWKMAILPIYTITFQTFASY